MINRDYLPYQSARNYQDRKMAKWMGFFLSEHTTAIKNDHMDIAFSTDLSDDQKLIFLSKAYVNKLKLSIKYLENKILSQKIGYIIEIEEKFIIIKISKKEFKRIEIRSIISLETKEDVNENL